MTSATSDHQQHKPPPERDLARIWAAQPFADRALTTTDGRPVRVIHPGRPAGVAGPDFRDAVVQVGDGPELVGDIEIHRQSAGFRRHGHAADAAYNGVVLHVVAAGTEVATTLQSGRQVPVVVLPEAPRAPAGREPCAGAVDRAGTERVTAVLAQAGRWRLERKAEALASHIATVGPGQALYRALAVALGQQANAAAFGLLADLLPLVQLTAPAQQARKSLDDVIMERLLHIAGLDGNLIGPASALPLITAGLRPAAHPATRLKALAALVGRLGGPDLVSGATALLDNALAGNPRGLVSSLIVKRPGGPALCGPSRALELAVNALLPWGAAVAVRAGDPNRARAILDQAGRLPATDPYGETAHLDRNLSNGPGKGLITNAMARQGTLALTREWCKKGGCGRCPLS